MDRQDHGKPPLPPQPPRFTRKLRAGWLQVVGVGLLALLPIAELTGLLGLEERESSVRSGDLELRVQYPSRMHHQTDGVLELRLVNHGNAPLAQATIRLPSDYLSGFSDLRFTPQPQQLGDRDVQVELGEIPAGELRKLLVEMRAETFGRYAGQIGASAGDGAPARLAIDTLVLP